MAENKKKEETGLERLPKPESLDEFKLFIVGESSGNPEDWTPWNPHRAIVVAHDKEEAISLVDSAASVAEIPLTRAVKLMSESAPDGL